MNPAANLDEANLTPGAGKAAAGALPQEARLPMASDLCAALTRKFLGQRVEIWVSGGSSDRIWKDTVTGIHIHHAQIAVETTGAIFPYSQIRALRIVPKEEQK